MAKEPVWEDTWTRMGANGANILVPDRAVKVQVVAVGAGGGGRGGWYNNGGRGAGGGAGKWAHGEWDVSPGTTIRYDPGYKGAGGSGGNIGSNQPAGKDGGATVIGQVTAAGGEAGPGGRDYRPGQSPGNHTVYGSVFTGGGETAGDGGFDGQAPGGGGAPGKAGGFLGGGTYGGAGAIGGAWYRFLVTPPLPAEWGEPGAITVDSDVIQSLHFEGAEIGELWLDGVLVWGGGAAMETVTIVNTGTSGGQLRAALTSRGLDYQTVTSIPFLLDTSQVTNMRQMFQYCSSLTSVPDIDTSQVTNMQQMFNSCSSLTSVPDMDTSQVTNMQQMFQYCSSLTSVHLTNADAIQYIDNAFTGCGSLTGLTLEGFGPAFFAPPDLPGSSPSSATLTLTATALTAATADTLMQSLGTAHATYPGRIALPATAQGCDNSIATTKGWTVTVA